MTQAQIDRMMDQANLPQPCGKPELIETHISWLILCDQFVYKIKKPVSFDFLDFSTLEKRKHYCEREVDLNRRLTTGMYLDVLPVLEDFGAFSVGTSDGEVVDYAVKMTRLAQERRMDVLLNKRSVTVEQVQAIAGQLADFHRKAPVLNLRVFLQMEHDFNDLLETARSRKDEIASAAWEQMCQATEATHTFLKDHIDLLNRRGREGFIRDVHGDLHSGNIFLLDQPVIFDCIEFNDELRQIDVLNELAFLCMDLEFHGLPGLAVEFFDYYNHVFPVCGDRDEEALFVFYKAYRANVRAKIHLLAMDEDNKAHLQEFRKYLDLMVHYLEAIDCKAW